MLFDQLLPLRKLWQKLRKHRSIFPIQLLRLLLAFLHILKPPLRLCHLCPNHLHIRLRPFSDCLLRSCCQLFRCRISASICIDLCPERLLLFPAINHCQRLPFCLRKLPFRKLALILSPSFLQLTLLHRKICFIALQQGFCLSSLLHCILCCLLCGSVTFLLCLLLGFRFCKHT